jgi:hypothetical protein
LAAARAVVENDFLDGVSIGEIHLPSGRQVLPRRRVREVAQIAIHRKI